MPTLGSLARLLAEVTLSPNAGAFPIPLARKPLRRAFLDEPPLLDYEIPPEYEGLFQTGRKADSAGR